MSVTRSACHDDAVPPEIVSTVFHSATVSDCMAILVAEIAGGVARLTLGQRGRRQLLGYGLDDLRSLPVDQLLPTLGGGELKLLLRRERAVRMTLPVRTASGAVVDSLVVATPVAQRPDVDAAHGLPPPTSRSARCAPPPTPTSGASPR